MNSMVEGNPRSSNEVSAIFFLSRYFPNIDTLVLRYDPANMECARKHAAFRQQNDPDAEAFFSEVPFDRKDRALVDYLDGLTVEETDAIDRGVRNALGLAERILPIPTRGVPGDENIDLKFTYLFMPLELRDLDELGLSRMPSL
jgi:hypothetical protein